MDILSNLKPQDMNPQDMNPQDMNPQDMNPQDMNPQDMNPQAVIRQTLSKHNIVIRDEKGIQALAALSRWKDLRPETYQQYIELLFTNFAWFPEIETLGIGDTFITISTSDFYSHDFEDCFEFIEKIAQTQPERAQERRKILDQVLSEVSEVGTDIQSGKEQILFHEEWRDVDNRIFKKYVSRLFSYDDWPKVITRVVADEDDLYYWYPKEDGRIKCKTLENWSDDLESDMRWGEQCSICLEDVFDRPVVKVSCKPGWTYQICKACQESGKGRTCSRCHKKH